MKRSLSVIFAALIPALAHADTCAKQLMPTFTAQEALQLCTKYPTSLNTTFTPQSDNAVDLGSSTKEWRTLYTGTSIVNAGDTITSTAAKGFVAGETARAANVTTATTLAAPLYLSAAASGTDLVALVGSGVSASGPVTDYFKTRATSGQASTIVSSGDVLGKIRFLGADGSAYQPGAQIIATVDTTPGVTNMPGALDFQLSPSGSATPASALKLTNDKKATFGGFITGVVGNEENIAGAGTNQGTAAALSATKNFHQLTGANGTVGWILATPVAGDWHIMMNTTSGIANIYPQTGGTINGAAANAVFAAATGIKPIVCFATSTTAWICS